MLLDGMHGILTIMLAQATTPSALAERWFDTDAGMLGMSLTLNVVLLGICWYLLRLLIKREEEKTKILEGTMHEVRIIYGQVLESTLDVTKAITELSTIIKRGGK
jgi:hypothetical protein